MDLAENKIIYREFCSKTDSVLLFAQPFWLDAVCGAEQWDVLLVRNGTEIQAALPVYWKTKLGFKVIVQPPLTPTNGIFLNYPPEQKTTKKLSWEKDVFNKLITEIETLPAASFYQQFPAGFGNWLPFYWQDFGQTTRYTYVLEDLSDLNKIYENFHTNIRTNIKKAEKNIKITVSSDIAKFYKLNQMTFSRQNLDIPHEYGFFKKLDEACAKNNCRQIFFAEDDKGQLHCAVYILWDKHSAYYLLSGTDPQFRNSGASSLVLWEAIKFAATVTQKFDFEGSMLEPIERFFRDFGGEQKPYFVISKDLSKPLKFIKNLTRLVK